MSSRDVSNGIMQKQINMDRNYSHRFVVYQHYIRIRMYAHSLRRDGDTIYLHTTGSNQFFSVTSRSYASMCQEAGESFSSMLFFYHTYTSCFPMRHSWQRFSRHVCA